MMRFYMIAGDVVSTAKGERPVAQEPEAIFCSNSTQHHSGWERLTAHAIHQRIAGHSYGEISLSEYERALGAIEKHREWQSEVIRRRGFWNTERERQRLERAKKKPPIAIREPVA